MAIIKNAIHTLKGTTVQVKTDGDKIILLNNGSPLLSMDYKDFAEVAESITDLADQIGFEKDNQED
jgi:hypothetical protein